MLSHLRPLGISLLLHLFLFGIALFWFTKDRAKIDPEPLKIHIATYLPSQPSNQPSPHQTNVIQQPQPVLSKAVPITPPVAHPPLQPTSAAVPTAITPLIPSPKPATVSQAAPTIETVKPSSVPAPPPAQPVNIEKEFLNAHLGEIRALLIQNLKYPRNAQRLKMQGEVRISFHLKSDGGVENIEVIQSSGFELLDEDAKALIKNTAPQFPKPTKSIRLSIPLSYLLH